MGILGNPRNRPDEYSWGDDGLIDGDPYSPVKVVRPPAEFSGVQGIEDVLTTARSFVSNNLLLVAAMAFGAWWFMFKKEKG